MPIDATSDIGNISIMVIIIRPPKPKYDVDVVKVKKITNIKTRSFIFFIKIFCKC